MTEQKFLATEEELRTAVLAALLKTGGTLEVSFEELGEAMTVCKLNAVRLAFERTANGASYTIVERRATEETTRHA